MRIVLALAIPILAATLQVTVVRFVRLGDVGPDLLGLVVVCWSLAVGAGEGIWWAFTGGIAADLLGSGAFGATTVSLLPIGFAFGLRERADVGVLSAAALVAAGTFAHQVLLALVLLVVGTPLPSLGPILGTAAGSAAYTGGLGLVVYPLLRVLHRRTAREVAFDW